MLGARLDETHYYGAFAMHGHTTDSELIRPRRRQEATARTTGPKRLVVAQLPDVSPADSVATGSIHYRFDHVDTTSVPLTGTSQTGQTAVQAAPVTRDWYRLTSGLAISAFLLYLAVHSLLEMKRVQKNVDAGIVNQSQRVDVAESPGAAAEARMIATPTAPEFVGNAIVADPYPPTGLLRDTDVIEMPAAAQPMDGSSDPIESTWEINPEPSAARPARGSAGESATPAVDVTHAGDYPGTGYPAIQSAPPTQRAGNVVRPDRSARLSGIIEKYTGPN